MKKTSFLLALFVSTIFFYKCDPITTTVITSPACGDEPCELKPGQLFKVQIGKYADLNTFSVKLTLQDRDTDIRLDITSSFEPNPFQVGTLVSAAPPYFSRAEGVHGAIWNMKSHADISSESTSQDLNTTWTTLFKPYRCSIENSTPFEMNVGELKSFAISFPSKAVADVIYVVSPTHDQAGDNMDAVVINQSNPSTEVNVTLRKDSDHSSIRLLGNEVGSISLVFKFPGGAIERLRINVN